MYEPVVDYQLSDAIRKVVSNYRKDKPIGRNALVRTVSLMGFPSNERQVRENIKQLRREGHLILSMPGEGGGYYMAQSQADYDEFMHQEFNAKITDMLETKRAMDSSAMRAFGSCGQASLF